MVIFHTYVKLPEGNKQIAAPCLLTDLNPHGWAEFPDRPIE